MAGDIPAHAGAGPQHGPNVSRRTSRGFFSKIFSKAQPTAVPQPMLSSHPFDSISLPAQRNDPAFSRDPSVHWAHSALPPPRATTSPAVGHKEKAAPIILEWSPPNHEQGYYNASNATQSTLTLLPSEYSSTSSHSPSSLSTPPIMPAAVDVDSPLTETFEAMTFSERPVSPPPEYDLVVEPRPAPLRNDSAPELRRVEAPCLPHRSATAPVPSTIPESHPAMRRRPLPYDLDRIDELDESNPLGVAMHHEGPFQAIASVLKASSAPRANQALNTNSRNARVPKIGGSLGISPGQIFPHSLQYYQPPPVRQIPPRDYTAQAQASTSYLPPQQPFSPPRFQQDYHDMPVASTSRLPAPQQFVQDPRFVRESSQWDQQTPYIPLQTQYDPIDDSYYAPEDGSGAYGGIEEEPIPRRDRRSAPPAPHSPPPLNVGSSRRFSAPQSSPQPPGLLDPRVLQNSGQPSTDQGSSGSRIHDTAFAYPPQANGPVELRQPVSIQPAPPPQQHNDPRRASYQPPPARADAHQQRLVAVQDRPQSVQAPSIQPAPPPPQHNDPRRASYQPPPARADAHQQRLGAVQDRPQSVQAPSIISSTATSQMRPRPHHVPKHLVMPTPLQRNAQLPARNQSGLPPPVSSQAQPTRAQTITMVQDKDGGRQLLRKRSSVMAPAATPAPPPPPVALKGAPVWRGPYMAPPPTVPEIHTHRPPPPAQDKKRHKRLSKKRTDL